MDDSYRDGYKEGVIFLFYQEGKILIEYRPTEDGGTETFIPNGTIEETDKAADDRDYVLTALHREVAEEFAGAVTVTDLDYLCEHKVEDPPLWFQAYVVTGWEGDLPDHTVEDGEQYAELEWVPLAEYEKHLSFSSARATCLALESYLDKHPEL